MTQSITENRKNTLVKLLFAALLSVFVSFAVVGFAPQQAYAASGQAAAEKLLVNAVNKHQTSITVTDKITKDELVKAYHRVYEAHTGEMSFNGFSLQKYSFSRAKGTQTWYVKTIKIGYRWSSAQVKSANSKTKSLTKQIIKGKKTQKQKARAIHDWIIKNTAYYTSSAKWKKVARDKAMTHYSVYNYHRANCVGYAETFKEMCKAAGIDCRVVVGKRNGSAHAWNKVKISGKWYYVDVCHDDPIVNGKDTTKGQSKYWLCSSSTFKKYGYRW